MTNARCVAKPWVVAAWLSVLAAPAWAGDGSWMVNASGNWSGTNNWADGAVADGAGATAWFTNNITTATRTITVDTDPRIVGILNIGDADGTHSFLINAAGGGGLVLGNNGANAQINQMSSSKGDTISAPLGLADALEVANASSNLLTISGAVTGMTAAARTLANTGIGSGGVTISGTIGDGAGTVAVVQSSATSLLTLSGANSFSGGLTIRAGTVAGIASAFALGTNTGTVTLGDSAGGQNATLVGGLAGTFANPIAVASGNTGTAAISNTAASIFSGPIALSGHDLVLAAAASTLTLSGGVTGSGNLLFNATGAGGITFSGSLLDPAGTMTNAGAGSGTVTISAGVGSNVTALVENSTNSALTVGTSNLTVNAGGTTLVNQNPAGVRILTVSGGVAGTGDLVLKNNSAITNGITLSTLAVNPAGTILNAGTGTGPVLISGGVGSNVTAVTTVSTGSALTISTVALAVNGGGTTLANNNPGGAAPLTVSGGITGTGNLTLLNGSAVSNGILIATGPVNPAGAVTNAGAGSGTVTISAVIGTNVTAVVQASATSPLILSGANTYRGLTTIDAGTLKLGAAATLPSTAVSNDLAIATAGQLDMNGFSQTIGMLTGSGLVDNAAGAGVYTLSVGNNSQTGTFSGVIRNTSGTLGLAKVGTGLQVVAGSNTYNGATAVGAGVLRLGAAHAIPNGPGRSNVVLAASTAVLDLGGFDDTVNGVTGTGAVTNSGSAATLTMGDADTSWTSANGYGGALAFSKIGAGTATVNGVIAIAGDLTVNGGMLALGAANTMSGAVAVNDGTLLVSNTTGSATGAGSVNVNSNGALIGRGRIHGPISLNPGGRLSPGLDGTAGGTLTVSNLTWYGGGVYVCEITNVANGVAGAGIDYDRLIVSNTLTAATNGSKLVLRLDSLGRDLSAGFQTNQNYALKLITCSTSLALNPDDVELDTNAFLVGGPWVVTNVNKSLYVVHIGQPDRNYWIGSGASTNWSTDANWSKGHAPRPGEDVVFDWSSTADCLANTVTNDLGSLTLADGYGGTVTFARNAVTNGMTLTVAGDITVNTGNLVFAGDTTFVGAGTPTKPFGRGYTLVASNITIAAGTSINADGMGFALGTGPSGVPGYHPTWSSAGHGGQGGGPETAPFDLTQRLPMYGSPVGPTELGSGLQVNDSDNNPGGGALKLVVSGTTTVNGRLSADASSRFPSSRGAGSGGSIWIASGTLQGNGRISANGTTVTSFTYGHGGGGRIDISGTTNNFTGLIQTSSSLQARIARGQCGSLLLPETAGTGATLVAPTGTGLVFGCSLTFTNPVTINSGVILSLDANTNENVFTFDSLTIKSGGVLRCLGNAPEINPAAGGATNVPYGVGVTIVASNLTIEAGGSLNANGQGYAAGPGAPGAYGGLASNGAGRTYGALAEPTVLGSGNGTLAQGGGAIRLVVYGTLTIDGTNSCNAATFAGSGGSLWIDCGTLQGSGVIAANALPSAGYGGSGGRIHILFTTNVFSGAITAYGGGTTTVNKGAAGTILLTDRSGVETNGTLIVDNNLAAAAQTVTLLPTNALCFSGTPPTLLLDRVMVRGNGVLALPEEKTLAVTTVFSNGAAFAAGTNSIVTLVGTNDARVYGSSAHEHLTISNEAFKTVRFEAGSTNTVRKMLRLHQAKLLSQSVGQWWYLTLDPAAGTQDVTRVRVQDSNATNGLTIRVEGTGSQNLEHNVNWRFPGGTASLMILR